jgi:GTPase Era involved in 16S rRNA processing
MLKKIGQEAGWVKALLDIKVFLQLWVKVERLAGRRGDPAGNGYGEAR